MIDTVDTKDVQTFQPTDPFLMVSFRISSDSGWANAAFHRLCIDNLSFSTAAYYVSPNGSDGNDGRTEATPLATIQKAIDRSTAGDNIFVMGGLYETKWGVNFNKVGMPAAWVVLRGYPGQTAEIKNTDWNLLKIGEGSKAKPSDAARPAYLEVRGLTLRGDAEEVEAMHRELVGQSTPETNGNGIGVDGRFMTNKPHHIRIADNEVSQCAGGGISVIHADRVQIENNHVHENSHWTIYATSGISIFQPFNFDMDQRGYRILVRRNKSHHNFCSQPWVVTGKLSDGNGIIIDDTRNTQNQSLNGVYRGGVLVVNNLSHDNGGSGMHSYSSDRVDFVHNTVCNNSIVMDYGQLSVTSCSNVRVLNNVMVAPKDKPLNRVNGNNSNVFLAHNLLWGGNGETVPGEFAIQEEPKFTDAANGNFSLSDKSPGTRILPVWEVVPTAIVDLGPAAGSDQVVPMHMTYLGASVDVTIRAARTSNEAR